MSRRGAAGVGLLLTCVLAGCGAGGAKNAVVLGREAADDVSRLLGLSVSRVEIPPSVLEDVAARAGIEAGMVPTVADDVARQRGWDRVVSRASQLSGRDTATEDVVAVASEAACSAFEERRDPTWEDVVSAAVGHFLQQPPDAVLAELGSATSELYEEMKEAGAEDDRARASVLLFCYAFTEIPELD